MHSVAKFFASQQYYEKLNKSKSKLTDDIPEKPKDEDVIDASDENIEEARKSLLELLEEREGKKWNELNY